MGETITDRLGDRVSGKVAVLVDLRDDSEYSLSLKPDISEVGTYSVVAKPIDGKGSQSFRMKYRGGEPLDKAMAHFEEYLNTDTHGTPFEVEVLSPPTKPAARRRGAGPQTLVDEWRDKLQKIEESRYVTAPQETYAKVLQARIAADPRKWRVGDGVGYKVYAGGRKAQINRGFAISEIDPENKVALVVQVAETGITVTGGRDVLEPEWVPLGDLVRDRRYDVEFT